MTINNLLHHKTFRLCIINAINMSHRRQLKRQQRAIRHNEAKKQWIAYVIMLVIVVSAIISIALAFK